MIENGIAKTATSYIWFTRSGSQFETLSNVAAVLARASYASKAEQMSR